jgi:error-prone DNA polymerase
MTGDMAAGSAGPGYAELQVTTHFSFLRGASSCEELFAQAAALGISALGITDRHSLAGIVRAYEASRQTGVRLVVGCRIDLTDSTALLLYPMDRVGYGRLCRLLTIGKARAGKGACDLSWGDVADWAEGLLAILVPDQADERCEQQLVRLRRTFPGRSYLALTLRRRPGDVLRLQLLSDMAAAHRVPTVVANDVLYHVPERRVMQDIVTCIRKGCTIDSVGFRRERYADRFLQPPSEITRLFARHPDAAARTLEVVERCRFGLDELQYQYPEEVVIPGLTAQQSLERLTWEAASQRYPHGTPEKVQAVVRNELRLIDPLG